MPIAKVYSKEKPIELMEMLIDTTMMMLKIQILVKLKRTWDSETSIHNITIQDIHFHNSDNIKEFHSTTLCHKLDQEMIQPVVQQDAMNTDMIGTHMLGIAL